MKGKKKYIFLIIFIVLFLTCVPTAGYVLLGYLPAKVVDSSAEAEALQGTEKTTPAAKIAVAEIPAVRPSFRKKHPAKAAKPNQILSRTGKARPIWVKRNLDPEIMAKYDLEN